MDEMNTNRHEVGGRREEQLALPFIRGEINVINLKIITLKAQVFSFITTTVLVITDKRN